jgi:hypothetical protein
MILGFASVTYLSSTVVDKFFQYAVGQDKTVISAYSLATKYAYGSDVKGAVLADTLLQWTFDHLYGQGLVMPDENPDDSTYYWLTWSC